MFGLQEADLLVEKIRKSGVCLSSFHQCEYLAIGFVWTSPVLSHGERKSGAFILKMVFWTVFVHIGFLYILTNRLDDNKTN